MCVWRYAGEGLVLDGTELEAREVSDRDYSHRMWLARQRHMLIAEEAAAAAQAKRKKKRRDLSFLPHDEDFQRIASENFDTDEAKH